MLQHQKIHSLKDFFAELKDRPQKGVYFYRINGYNDAINEFLKEYYELARRTGVIIEGKIPNPDEKNLAYYNEIMGPNFQNNLEFVNASLKKWLPRMDEFQRQAVASAIFDSLDNLRKAGKTESMIKNSYIKFMCWLYYKFERVVSQLGANSIPKILYEGSISNYELMLISILSNAGCDVVLLQHDCEQNYLKLDPKSELSEVLQLDGMKPFPPGYNLKTMREYLKNAVSVERLYGSAPSLLPCTNAWISGKALDDIRSSVLARGDDERYFYNCFCRINGAEDKNFYAAELFQFQQEIRNSKRQLVIVNKEIPKPTSDEIAGIRRQNYNKLEQLILDLLGNIKYTANADLHRILHKAFVDIVLEESKAVDGNLNRLTNKAIYLLCWLKRYMSGLFSNWKKPEIACFIHMGACQNENEALFLRFLARLPVDVLILCPNLNQKCCLNDKLLYEVNNPESLNIEDYPDFNVQAKLGTVAFHAEKELNTILYQDTGLYRTQQYSKANVVNLQTMYEEIKQLWDVELKYRQGFCTTDDVVTIPVIFAKLSGVKDGDVKRYWTSIRELIVDDAILISKAPYIQSRAPNPMKAYATDFYKNGKMQKRAMKTHPNFPYKILREEMQDFMLEKLEILIEQRLIRGIGENGTEYTVIATVLNMPKEILRLIQKFDFTKKNPKLIYVNADETVISLEDSIIVAFLNLIGFDIVFFVPTGYQNVEQHFRVNAMEEIQMGEYLYDLKVPDLKKISLKTSWRERLFGRGK